MLSNRVLMLTEAVDHAGHPVMSVNQAAPSAGKHSVANQLSGEPSVVGMLPKAASFGPELQRHAHRGQKHDRGAGNGSGSALRHPLSFMGPRAKPTVVPDSLVADLPSPTASSPSNGDDNALYFGQYKSKIIGVADSPTPRNVINPGPQHQSAIFSPTSLHRSSAHADAALPRKKAGKVEDFIPELVIQHVQRCVATSSDGVAVPSADTFTAVVMFADLSGFTVMSESLATKGGLGAENLGFWLNRYFEQLVKLVAKAGGDVFKFAGDALIALWGPEPRRPPDGGRLDGSPARGTGLAPSSCASASVGYPAGVASADYGAMDVERMMRRAIQCALQIQNELHDAQFARGVKFSIKIGIGVGPVNILYLGGLLGRMEYVTTGEALAHALQCEHECRFVSCGVGDGGCVRAQLSPG